jgi:peptidylprolyl isomerase domain and WD repeat-containing protein 1
LNAVISADVAGMIEYWSPETYLQPTTVSFKYKTDTDLYEFAKHKTVPMSLNFSPDQRLFATIGRDRMIRIFHAVTGKLYRVYDETLTTITEMQLQTTNPLLKLDNMEFGRRVAVEREFEKSDAIYYQNAVFDESGHFLLYPSLLGIKCQ